MSITSRRAFLAGMATVPAATAAMAAVAMPQTSLSAVPAVAGSTAKTGKTYIENCWAEAKAIMRKYRVARKQADAIWDRIVAEMPKPHPSIVYGPDNDADGLVYWVPDREPHTLNRQIPASSIEWRLNDLENPVSRSVTIEGLQYFSVPNDPADRLPPDPATKDLRDRLKARLELARAYEARLKATEKKYGYARAEKKTERLLSQRSNVELRIFKAPAQTANDLAIKFKVAKDWDISGNLANDSLLKELRRLVDRPEVWPA